MYMYMQNAYNIEMKNALNKNLKCLQYKPEMQALKT